MLDRLIRFAAATVLFVYGFAKINGSQFTILDSELDKQMGQVSGFWLTWYYFGYSQVYGTVIALVQIVGALLLTFRRTALLGACVLAPVLGNIILIDICYGVDPGAALVAVLLLIATISVIAPRWKDLNNLFLPSWPKISNASRSPVAVKWLIRFSMLAAAFAFTYWIANFNNRAPTPIDGAWDVVKVVPDSAAGQVPTTIYFEYNRAHMTVFKLKDGAYRTHHFEVQGNDGGVTLWEQWLRKGAEIFSGHYTLEGPSLRLSGRWQNIGALELTLHRRAVR